MAMRDWNGNGRKNDIGDRYIEYQIYKDCTSNDNTQRKASKSSGSTLLIVLLIACIVSIFDENVGTMILLGYGFLKILGM